MKNGKALYELTQCFVSIIESRADLRNEMSTILSEPSVSFLVRMCVKEIKEFLLRGISIGNSFEKIKSIKIPQWYKGFLCACEEAGCIDKGFLFLKEVLDEQKKVKAKLHKTLLYPISVCILSFIAFLLVWKIMSSSGITNDDVIIKSMYRGVFFILCSFITGFFFVRKVFDYNPAVFMFRLLSFACENGISIERALDCSFRIFNGNEKLEEMILNTRRRIRHGENIISVFNSELNRFGFKKESKIVSSYLSIYKGRSISKRLEKISDFLESKNNEFHEKVLLIMPSLVMFLLTVYLYLILKDSVFLIFSGTSSFGL